jgi:hypothetical protein
MGVKFAIAKQSADESGEKNERVLDFTSGFAAFSAWLHRWPSTTWEYVEVKDG